MGVRIERLRPLQDLALDLLYVESSFETAFFVRGERGGLSDIMRLRKALPQCPPRRDVFMVVQHWPILDCEIRLASDGERFWLLETVRPSLLLDLDHIACVEAVISLLEEAEAAGRKQA